MIKYESRGLFGDWPGFFYCLELSIFIFSWQIFKSWFYRFRIEGPALAPSFLCPFLI